MIILEVYLMSWLNALNKKGLFPTKDDMYNYYSLQGTLGCVFAFVFLGFFGFLIDKVSVKITLPLSFLVRAGVFYMCYTIENPWEQKVKYFATMPFIHVTLYMVTISINSYLLKMYPKNIRGLCIMTANIISAIGGFVIPSFFEMLYEKDPSLPFLGVAISDLGSIVLCLIFFMFGFGNPITVNVEDDESNLSGSIHSENSEELANTPILSK